MNIDYFKIWLINGTTLFISLQNIDYFFKFILLIVSIGFTVTKWYQLLKKDPDNFPAFRKDEPKNDKDETN